MTSDYDHTLIQGIPVGVKWRANLKGGYRAQPKTPQQLPKNNPKRNILRLRHIFYGFLVSLSIFQWKLYLQKVEIYI